MGESGRERLGSKLKAFVVFLYLRCYNDSIRKNGRLDMQFRLKGRVIYTYSVRRLVYALCFLLFCVINQRCATVHGRGVFRDLTGAVMAIIILSHYHFEDFRKWKIPHVIWTAVWIVGAPIVFFFGGYTIAVKDIRMEWWAIALGVVLFGYVLVNTFGSVVLEKKYPKMNLKYGAVWLIMMLLMILSRSTYIWPFSYLVMFGCFYLTDFSQEEKKDLFHGMLDGIILGFFVLQSYCFVFRPYDVVRYSGVFSNSNSNSLFYVMVLAAVFTKIIYVVKNQSNKWVRMYYWVGAGVLLSFELLTLGRTGWLTAIILMIAFIRFMAKDRLHKRWWKNLLALILAVCLTFPLCFSAVRYLPPLFHHPVWFPGEWDKSRVHSWDPWNSEKYIDIDEFFDAAIGRVLQSLQNVMEHSPLLLIVNAAGTDAAEMEPLLTLEQRKDSLLIRGSIYKYYFQHLNLRGHPYEEQGFQLFETYRVPHAHNIFLQYGTDFGIPVMLLFAMLIVWGAILLGRRYQQQGLETDAGCWMFLLIPAIYGLFECSWETGSLSVLMMFVAWREIICSEK